jgi:hypothetical protein
MGSKIGPPILNCQIQGQRKNVVTLTYLFIIYFSLFDDLHDLFAYEIFLQDQPKKFFFVKWGWLGAE